MGAHLCMTLLLFAEVLSGCKIVDDQSSTIKDQEGTPTVNELAGSTHLGSHGMVVFGDKTVYMYHLPMWQGLHAWQIVLEVGFDDNTAKLYTTDRNAGSPLNTFAPDPFALAQLKPGFSFTGELFHGHFEQDGKLLSHQQAVVTVKRLVMIVPLDPDAPALKTPIFRLFGHGDEWYLAHVAAKRPNFDQVLKIAPVAGVLTEAQLNRGVGLEISGKTDDLADRLQPGDSATGEATGGMPITVSVEDESYFSTLDLGN